MDFKPNIEKNKTPKDKLELLAFSLGFVETDEMKKIRSSFIFENGVEKDLDSFIKWQTLAEKEILTITGQLDYQKAQIGLYVFIAKLYKQYNNIQMYNDTLNDIDMYAKNIDLNINI